MNLVYFIISICQILTFPALGNHLSTKGKQSIPGELRLPFQVNCGYHLNQAEVCGLTRIIYCPMIHDWNSEPKSYMLFIYSANIQSELFFYSH